MTEHAYAVEVLLTPEQPALVLPVEQTYVTETATGLLFAEDTPIEIWGALVERLTRQHKRIEWAIGDALQFGERRYGDTYAQWVEETGLSENTLATIKWVAGKIESSRRREDVGWSHHREVAALPPPVQDRLLAEAAEKGLTRYQVRVAAQLLDDEGRGRAVDATGTPVEEPEPLVWVPGRSELSADARAMLEQKLAGMGRRHHVGYERGFIDALVWLQQEDCFEEWRQ